MMREFRPSIPPRTCGIRPRTQCDADAREFPGHMAEPSRELSHSGAGDKQVNGVGGRGSGSDWTGEELVRNASTGRSISPENPSSGGRGSVQVAEARSIPAAPEIGAEHSANPREEDLEAGRVAESQEILAEEAPERAPGGEDLEAGRVAESQVIQAADAPERAPGGEDLETGWAPESQKIQAEEAPDVERAGSGGSHELQVNTSEIEIKNLVWIKAKKEFEKKGLKGEALIQKREQFRRDQIKREQLKEALAEWERKIELFTSRVDRKNTQSLSVLNEIYQLIGFYSVFQGVLLTAVAQAALLRCPNWWSVFFLSLLASLVTIGGVIQKFLSIRSLEKTICSEESTRRLLINRVLRLKLKGEKFEFSKDAKDPPANSHKTIRKNKFRLRLFVLVIIVLALFSVLFLVSFYWILCFS